MTKNFLTHFSAITLVHVFVLLGSFHLIQPEYFRSQLSKIAPGVLKLRIATQVLQAPVQKTISKKVPEKSLHQIQQVAPSSRSEANTVPNVGNPQNFKNDALATYKAELRAMIDKNKSYPVMSKRLGQTGTVVVAFTLLEDGNIIDVRIDTPSRYERLNVSALEAVKKVSKFRPLPKEIGESRLDIKVPLKFLTI